MNKLLFHKDLTNHTMTVERTFVAPRARVWEAWTRSDLLDQWWAPEPWKAITKSFDFRAGGHWHYAMQGPDGTNVWCWIGYESIDAENSFTALDAFCDEDGNLGTEMPTTHWKNEFHADGDTTKIFITLTFKSTEDMEKLIAMGFEEGFSMGLGNLDRLLQA